MIGEIVACATVAAAGLGVALYLIQRKKEAPDFEFGGVDVRYVEGVHTSNPSRRMESVFRYGGLAPEAAIGHLRGFIYARCGAKAVDLTMNFSLEIRAPDDAYMVQARLSGATDLYRPSPFSRKRPRVTIRMLYADRDDVRPLTEDTAAELRHPAETALFHEVIEHVLPFALWGTMNERHANDGLKKLADDCLAGWKAKVQPMEEEK